MVSTNEVTNNGMKVTDDGEAGCYLDEDKEFNGKIMGECPTLLKSLAR